MNYHHKIKTLREERRFSQQEVAYKIDMPTSTYQLMESGKTDLKLKHALALSELFEVPLEEIYKEDLHTLNIYGNTTIETGGQQINQSVVNIELKDMIEYLKSQSIKKDELLLNKDEQMKIRDGQISIHIEQINRMITLLENFKK